MFGYVVVSGHGEILGAEKDPYGNAKGVTLLVSVLGFGGKVFTSETAAAKAVGDTIAYEQKHGLKWGTVSCTVQKIRLPNTKK